jgi:hypothetical protein
MKKYEICVVSKEYRYVEVEAEDEIQAREKVWQDLLDADFFDTKPQGYDTEVFTECEIHNTAAHT